MFPLNQPAMSIIVPVHNSGVTLTRCLAAVSSQMHDADELLVVDDGSTDDVGTAVAPFPKATVHRLNPRAGVAAARNRGAAAATRPVLFFVDADVVLHDDALARGRARMADPAIDALIGSYDDTPEAPAQVSRFKNLAHHYFHQRAAGDVSSFWGACGFVRRDLLATVGGFDERHFSQPSIEDVELGWRLTDRGARIVLDPDLQVTHLKRWTFGSLFIADMHRRAIPWVRWSLARRRLPAELNASLEQKLAALVAVATLVMGLASFFFAAARVPVLLLMLAAMAINFRLFALFWRKGGPRLLVTGFILQQLYYLCAATGAAAGLMLHCLPGRKGLSAPPTRATY